GAPPRTGWTPFSRTRNTRPDCVSPGILSTTSPSSVGTSTEPPRAAVVKLIGTSQDRLLPSRSNIACSRTWISTYRSPAGPPLRPASPSPLRRIRSPASTPAGTVIDRAFSWRTRPWPRQVSQGLLTILPRPLQRGQGCWIVKIDCCTRTWPWPPQVSQVLGAEPLAAPEPLQVLHSASDGICMSVFV